MTPSEQAALLQAAWAVLAAAGLLEGCRCGQCEHVHAAKRVIREGARDLQVARLQIAPRPALGAGKE